MPDQVQLRGGTEEENDSFTGAQREVTVDTTNNTLRVHDGTTTGGHPLTQGTASTDADDDTIIKRDEWGRAQVADPEVDADIANKAYVDGVIGDSVVIATRHIELDVDAGSVVFDGISEDAVEVRLTWQARSSRDDAVRSGVSLRINDDGGSNYSTQYIRLNDTTVSGINQSGQDSVYVGSATSSQAGSMLWAIGKVVILNTSGADVSMVWEAGQHTDTGSSRRFETGQGFKSGMDKVTKIEVLCNVDEFVGGSFFTLSEIGVSV